MQEEIEASIQAAVQKSAQSLKTFLDDSPEDHKENRTATAGLAPGAGPAKALSFAEGTPGGLSFLEERQNNLPLLADKVP